MRYVFNYPVTVPVATEDGNLGRLRFGCGETIVAVNSAFDFVDGQRVLNLELADGSILIHVPAVALRYEGTVAGTAVRPVLI